MKIRRGHYDVFRRAVMMILKHFDARFSFHDHHIEPPDFITWNVGDFDLVRRAFLMMLRHAEKVSGWSSNKSHP